MRQSIGGIRRLRLNRPSMDAVISALVAGARRGPGVVLGFGRHVILAWLFPPPPEVCNSQSVLLTRARAKICELHLHNRLLSWLEGEVAEFLWGEERTAERTLRRLVLFLVATPAIGAGMATAVGVAGHHLFPPAVALLVVLWASCDWILRRFLAKGPERTVLRPALAASGVGSGVLWVLGDAPVLLLIVLVALTATFAGLRLLHAHLAESAAGQASAPASDVPPAVLRMEEHWRWFSLQLRLRGVKLQYDSEDDGEDHLILTLPVRANHDRLRAALRAAPGRFDVLLKLPRGSCRLQPEPDRADRYHLFVWRPDDERRFERLLGTSGGAQEPEPTPDERLEALLAANPGMSNAEVVKAMAGMLSERAVYDRLRRLGRTRPYAQRGLGSSKEAV